MKAFLDHVVPGYAEARDRPDQRGTSALSPHLHFGELSVRQVWHTTLRRCAKEDEPAAMAFLRELGWRDFNYNLLYHFPHLPEQNLRAQFDAFAWAEDRDALASWQRGKTGYPVVDAGMRQLWYTGWMHNRVRMITASFLIKHLLIDWRAGQSWFWNTLVDADLASNAANWQWVAGSGADASPYFRIFNPITQAKKFDPDGDYIRRWVPELAQLQSSDIHAPWEADSDRLAAAGVRLGDNYPLPIVDHRQARERALAAYAMLSK
jgi:deoxyribodipyrimidine photo-lyase